MFVVRPDLWGGLQGQWVGVGGVGGGIVLCDLSSMHCSWIVNHYRTLDLYKCR